jgi:hypothetical protein
MSLPTINVPDFGGILRTIFTPNSGRQNAADSAAATLSNEDFAALGALTETAPGTDTASSGLNGRLQRIAQRLTSLITLFPTSLGTKTAANSLAVTLASDGPFITSIGAPADSSASSDSGTFSLIALFKRALGYLATIATSAGSTAPVPVEVGPFKPREIAASQTNAAIGATGAAGDYLSHLIIQPATTSPGVVTLYDGSTGGTNVTVYSFPGGSSSLSNLSPIIIGLASTCVNAGWHVTTGANVSVTAVGTFT